ncbi:hypothetical protein ACT4S2_10330 [Kocuria turfanensis]|uniref:hypothetical protein n=1 Tax=Kocuria turfanensis TaxID=388357 RepID=UPI0040360612
MHSLPDSPAASPTVAVLGGDADPAPGHGRAGLPAADAPPADATVLAPAEEFPETLEDLSLVELQVLHSRVTRQVEREHLSPEGPHPLTRDRHCDVAAELAARGLLRIG